MGRLRFKSEMMIQAWYQKISWTLERFFLCLVFTPLAAALYFPKAQNYLILSAKDGAVATVLVAIGTVLGSMVALISTLSIVPIQRAAETMTPTIRGLFVRDKKIVLPLIFLSILCVAAFIFALAHKESVYVQVKSIPIFILLSAASFDLLRMLQGRVSSLLEPQVAVELLFEQAAKTIRKIDVRLKRASILFQPVECSDTMGSDPAAIKASIYTRSGLDDLFLLRVRDLANIAVKSMDRHEPFTANVACKKISLLTNQFLEVRSPSVLFQTTFDVGIRSVASIEGVVQGFMESLRQLGFTAAEEKQYATFIAVMECYAEVSGKLIAIRVPNETSSAPLAYLAVGYAKTCLKYALDLKIYDDIAMQAINCLYRMSAQSPENTRVEELHAHVFEAFRETAEHLLKAGKTYLAFPILDKMMMLLTIHYEKRHFQFDHMLDDVLEIALGQLTFAPVESVGIRDYPPYSTVSEHSLYVFFKDVQNRYLSESELESDELDNKGNAIGDLEEVLEKLRMHYRSIADRFNFGAHRTLWSILRTLKEVATDLISIRNGDLITQWDKDKIDRQILKFTQLPQWFFRRERLFLRYADDASDDAAYIGLSAAKHGIPNVPEASLQAIRSILERVVATNSAESHYTYADLMMNIWYVRMYAESIDNQALIGVADSRLTQPSGMTGEYWKEVQRAFEHRQRQCLEDLRGGRRGLLEDRAEDLLGTLLQC